MQKKGQFFLFAAIVAVAALLGVTATFNTVVDSGTEQQPFYDLSKEIGFETKTVLDYGVFDEKDTPLLAQEFLTEYSKYIAQDKVLFLVGNAGNVRAYYFTNNAGTIGLSTGSIPNNFVIQQSTQSTADVTKDGNSVYVKIDSITYNFDLNPGQNFYFVIIKDIRDERFVAKG